MSQVGARGVVCTTVVAFISAAVIETASAQTRTTIDADTTFVVRTTEAIDVKSADGLIFTGTVEEDVSIETGMSLSLKARPWSFWPEKMAMK